MSFPRYPKYKDSGVEWLGEVPEHWEVERFKKSVSACRNGIWGTEAQGNDGDIPCVRVADFDRQSLRVTLQAPTIRNVSASERDGRLLSRGNLLLEKSGGGELQPVGCVVLYEDDTRAICSNFVARMELADGMDPSFFRYLHTAAYTVRLNTRSIKQTSGIQNLDQQQYLDERAAFPPSEDQTAIAAFLDRETAKIDALIAEQQRLIELLQEKRQAVISHAVTKGLNPDAPMKDSGIEWLGEVPEHWEVVRLKHLIETGTSISYGIVQPGDPLDGGVPFVQTTNMTSGDFALKLLQRTSTEIASQYPRSTLKGGEVLLGIRASIGAAHVVPNSLAGANLSRGVARIVPNIKIESSFLVAALRSDVTFTYWGLSQQGSTFNEVSIATVKELSIAVPPRDEQHEITKFVRVESERLDSLIAEAEQAITLLQERRSALISAAVTGQIDVRGLAGSEAA